MTAPDTDEPSGGDRGAPDQARAVWTPAVLQTARDAGQDIDSPAAALPEADAAANEAPPAPPWRAPGQPRLVALDGGRSERDQEVADLRKETTLANQRLGRLRGLLKSFDDQLFDARNEAATAGEAARSAEQRVAELEAQLAAAHEELARLRARARAQPARVVAHVDHHHRSLLASLRSDPVLVDDETETIGIDDQSPAGPGPQLPL